MELKPLDEGIEREAFLFSLKGMVSRALNLQPDEIRLADVEVMGRKRRRFFYGFTESSGERGFFKLANNRELNLQLQREVFGNELAARLGIPCLRVLTPYQETEQGYGLIHLEQVSGETTVLLTNSELIAGADSTYGRVAARKIIEVIAKEIPEDVDTSLLKRDDKRNKSPESFFYKYKKASDIVLDSQFDDKRNKLIPKERLKVIIEETASTAKLLINQSQGGEKEYFVHNDMSISNVFFSESSEGIEPQIIFLDFEYAGATRNRFLAQLTDVGNFFGRMWPNPEMQKQFITAFIESSTQETLDENRALLKTAIVFGTIYLTHYVIEETYHEHAMSVSLLCNLDSNLDRLEEVYNKAKTSLASQEK